ncbi:glycerophosphoryl diester phosphodiesterase membrane domain-containing protein [Tsuneonella suprasediminis]|uniref:glycerophosphoryl diester phosphodiesterase membrane domain-containing protein n=1 Tax=Tsuneonella suprasediminis TaxID=2306996 RepID=UPI002F92751A
MKFDMSKAWEDATRLISANRDVMLVVAGVFFFLPYFAFALLMGNRMVEVEASMASNGDPEAAMQAMTALYGSIWWVIILVTIVQGIGMLGLLALLTDRRRPTVGEALAIGAKLFVPYLVAQLLVGFAMGLLMIVPIAIGAAGSVAAAVIVGLALVVLAIYVFVKFVMVAPVIAIERVSNPIAALRRSWRLTKGNSLRIFLFLMLLMLAIAVVGSVIGLVVGLILAIGGPEVATIGQAIVSGLMNSVWVTLLLAVLAAIHRQLTGGSPEAVSETFD